VLTQQVKYLAECVKEFASNSKPKEPYGIPGPLGISDKNQLSISDDEMTIKEGKGATSKKGSRQDTTLMEEKKKKSTANKKEKDKEKPGKNIKKTNR